MNTFELNNVKRDSEYFTGKFTKNSPVIEIFSAMVNGQELSKFGKKADEAVNYIKGLGTRAQNGDFSAVAELNTLRKFTIEPKLLEEIKLLGIFGTYVALGYDETPEAEVYQHVGQKSRSQAAGGDVAFPTIVKEIYQVPTQMISGGFAVDYRRVELGDMSKENEGMEQVRIDIRNRAALAVVKKVFDAVENATGVKYFFEGAGLTKTGVDGVLTSVRRFGRPTIVGDYALVSQITPFAGYVGTIGTNTITGISEKAMNEISQNGLLGMYNGAVISETPNQYDLTTLDAAGTNFETMLPAGLGFVLPTGVQSPVRTWTKGGLTSMTGNDVATGKIVTRFDLEFSVDVAKGQEHRLAVLHDTNLDTL
jgi:hypothetical protein